MEGYVRITLPRGAWLGRPPTGFLLADYSQRCGPDSEILPGVLILYQTNPHPSPRVPDNPHHLAFHHMGPFKKALRDWTHLIAAID
jgi:hypothetical protein